MKDRGFALIELIITLTLVAVLAAMVVPFFKPSVTRGADPLGFMNTPLGVQTIMASIIADYSSNATYLHDLTLLNSQIVNGNYGLTASCTIVKNSNYKFDPSDMDTALLVTIKDNASNQSVSYVFTKQL
jgi:prepilin-type N-terminal cleavage/methylation domain-containing protein